MTENLAPISNSAATTSSDSLISSLRQDIILNVISTFYSFNDWKLVCGKKDDYTRLVVIDIGFIELVSCTRSFGDTLSDRASCAGLRSRLTNPLGIVFYILPTALCRSGDLGRGITDAAAFPLL